jgi:hypothetical protein
MYPPLANSGSSPGGDSGSLGIAKLDGELHNESGSGALMPQGGPGQNLVTIPMTEEERGQWQTRIQQATDRRKHTEQAWDVLLRSYLPTVKDGPVLLKVMLHFRNVHSKIGQLFYRSPEMILTPRGPATDQLPLPAPAPPGPPPMGAPPVPGPPPPQPPPPAGAPPVPGALGGGPPAGGGLPSGGPIGLPGGAPPPTAEDTVSLKQAVLNWYLGRDGINGVRLTDEVLFDVLAWAGIGIAKVCYRVVTQPIAQPGTAGVAMGAVGPPQQIHVPIYEWWEARRLSPKKFLFDANLHSTRYDEDAAWEGMDFFASPQQICEMFNLTPDEVGNGGVDDDRLFKYDSDSNTRSKTGGLIHGVELTYKASLFDAAEKHPLKMRQLVFIDGIKDRPVVHRDSPDQTFDDRGQITDDSLIGFPYQVLTIRDLADSPYPPADSAFTDASQKELSTFRRQKIQLRDAAIGKLLVDEGAFGEDELDKLTYGDPGQIVLVQEGRLAGGSKRILDTTAQVQGTADDYRTESTIKHEVDETLGIGGNQAGTPESTVRSATETATVAAAVSARNGKEQARVIDWYVGLARKLDALLMRYATNDDYIAIAGDDGARTLAVWNARKISGRYLYDIKPDSQLFVDAARDRQQQLTLYNLAGKDPLVNRAELLKPVLRSFGHDPAKTINPPPPPQPPPPDKPNISFTFKGDDFLNPELKPILLGLLQMATAPNAPPPMIQPPHGGPMTPASPVNQHAAGHSGGVPNAPGATARLERIHPAQAESGHPGPTAPGVGRIQ